MQKSGRKPIGQDDEVENKISLVSPQKPYLLELVLEDGLLAFDAFEYGPPYNVDSRTTSSNRISLKKFIPRTPTVHTSLGNKNTITFSNQLFAFSSLPLLRLLFLLLQ
ncbi:hypothetical protein TcWFU_005392 [Taenia crassiceps]|uniref:Uncharacterized protein n=1 Tax=Taenia crassiceps TaxID=6207 RepID=A0ABR4Q7K6_9CEST